MRGQTCAHVGDSRGLGGEKEKETRRLEERMCVHERVLAYVPKGKVRNNYNRSRFKFREDTLCKLGACVLQFPDVSCAFEPEKESCVEKL